MSNDFPSGRLPALRRRRTKSSDDMGTALESGGSSPSEPTAKEDAEGAENTAASPGIQTESEEASSVILDSVGDDLEDDPGALVLDEGLDVFVQRSSEAWVITPLSGHLRLELRPMPADGLPPAGSDGVIWRLDDKVLAQGTEEQWEDGEDFPSAARQDNEGLARSVSRRIKKVSSGMRRLRSVTEKLEAKLARYQEDQVQLEKQRRRLQRGREDLSKEQGDLAKLRSQLEEERAKLALQRSEFNDEVRKVTENLVHSKRLAVGDSMLPPSVFFAAAQEVFVRGAPELLPEDEAALARMRPRPEAAFGTACNDFLASGACLGAGADALVNALLAFQCLLDAKAPVRVAQSLEQLAGVSRGVAKVANVGGRMRLSFAASSCTLWCGLQLADYLAQRWDEANLPEVIQELSEENPDVGFLQKRSKFIQQIGSSMKRVLRSLVDYADHRRRFLCCLAKPGVDAAEYDLRLLFLPREARPSELAAHVRRLRRKLSA
ncbi:ECE2 [Symbiodinium sp. CCMP2456]|nr:ECE2 [Symbiodinium sp. CCMP2456]